MSRPTKIIADTFRGIRQTGKCPSCSCGGRRGVQVLVSGTCQCDCHDVDARVDALARIIEATRRLREVYEEPWYERRSRRSIPDPFAIRDALFQALDDFERLTGAK